MQMFEGLIGQKSVKSRLTFYKKGFDKTRILPPLFFVGESGVGKTQFVKEFASNLTKEDGSRRPLLTLNCSSVKSLGSFFDDIIIPHVLNREITLFGDEAHALPHDVTDALLTILNTEDSPIVDYLAKNGVNYQFDFTKLSVIFATTESERVFRPLRERMTLVDFTEYNNEELKQIFVSKLPNIQFEPAALDVLAQTSRGNARACVVRSKQVLFYCETENVSKFTLKHANDLFDILGVKPHGLNQIELKLLQILRQKGSCTLSHLASVTGLSSSCIRSDHELFLVRKGFMSINGLRQITRFGAELVDNYGKNQAT
jgi:Holliday junction resolvasome RuvABC ATP-dependent DNA helicase subunit